MRVGAGQLVQALVRISLWMPTLNAGAARINQTDSDIAYLEAVQRGRGRAEKLICNLKDTGCTNLPSADFELPPLHLLSEPPS